MIYIIEIFSIVAGIFYIFMGAAKYGWWEGISISGGFMPVVSGAFLVVFAIWMLVEKVKKGDKAEKFQSRCFLPVGAMLLILLCNYLTGMLGACAVVMFLWMKFYEKYSWLKSFMATLMIMAFVYGVFRIWLNVPFPKGFAGNLMAAWR